MHTFSKAAGYAALLQVVVLVALALFGKLRGQVPGLIWLATEAGLMAATLMLASGAIGFKGLAILVAAPDRAAAGIALPAFAAVWAAVDDVGLFALAGGFSWPVGPLCAPALCRSGSTPLACSPARSKS